VASRQTGSDRQARRRRPLECALAGLLVVVAWTGCTYTVAGDLPAAIEPPPPSFQPAVEYTVADFKFALGGNDMTTSIFDGRELSSEIVQSWQRRGYVRSEQYVADGSFSGTADYHLTLRSGSQHGETSFAMQIVNALFLSLMPYSITQCYDFQYDLEDVKSGARYSATVQASDKTWVDGLLILAMPFADRGHLETMQRVGDDLYDQFRRQGAFTSRSAS
jgi:hypothetical protein